MVQFERLTSAQYDAFLAQGSHAASDLGNTIAQDDYVDGYQCVTG